MNKQTISIILADDHPIMLQGLQQELEQVGFTITDTAVNGAAAIEAIVANQPDIAILDVEMPFLNGFEVIKISRQQSPKTRYIIMSYHKEKGFLVQAKKIGVQGYLLKEDSIKDVEKCILEVMKNQIFYSPNFEENIELYAEKELKKVALLTPSERTIIRLIAQGNNSSQIGSILSISMRTVQKHRTNIIAKLELEPGADALGLWAKANAEVILTL